MQENKLSAMVVDPNAQSRMRLKQATVPVPTFAEVNLLGALPEASSRLNSDRPCDIVFLSYRFNLEEITKFIEESKKSKGGQDAAFVMVVQSGEQDNSMVSSFMMAGINGFLCEPYSVDSLVELTEIARRIRRERQLAREKLAVSLLMREIITQIDLVACIKASGYAVSRSAEKLEGLCEQLNLMSEENKQARMEVVIQELIDAKAASRALSLRKYGGTSQRVRERMEKKLVRDSVRREEH